MRTCAACIVGAPRSFVAVAESMYQALSNSTDNLFVFRWTNESFHSSKVTTVRDSSVRFDLEWSHIVAQTQRFDPIVVTTSRTTFKPNNHCTLDSAES